MGQHSGGEPLDRPGKVVESLWQKLKQWFTQPAVNIGFGVETALPLLTLIPTTVSVVLLTLFGDSKYELMVGVAGFEPATT